MKKILKTSILIILIITILFVFNIFFSKNNIRIKKEEKIENIKKSIVKIIPEDMLISYSDNPSGVNNDYKYGIGAGFFINKDNQIITANHVIENKNIKYYIITSDDQKYLANIISRDFNNDTALIQIDSRVEYNYLKINKNYKIGDKIYSFGINGEKQDIIFKDGKITDKNKKLDNISNLIEFTPQITKGFSGGPILNSNFQVIGINHAIKDGKSYGIITN